MILLSRRVALAAAVAAMSPLGAKAASATGKRLLVLDFDLVDTSQEPTDQSAAHLRRLARIRDDIAAGLAAENIYDIVDRSSVAGDLDAIQKQTYIRTCNGCELTLGKKAGADLVLLGQVNKVSTLVMSLDVAIKNVANGEALYRQRFDFRGDNDYSWARTTKYVVARIARDPPT